jgi:iron uptake system EfeUOB component EfeO/EfeM
MELSSAFLDLLRKAAEKNSEWQATQEAVLRKDENVVEELEVKDGLLYYENRWVIPDALALKLRFQSQKRDSKAEKPAHGSEASRMLRTAIEDRWKPRGGQRHRECLRSLSSLRIAGSLKEASGIEDA